MLKRFLSILLIILLSGCGGGGGGSSSTSNPPAQMPEPQEDILEVAPNTARSFVSGSAPLNKTPNQIQSEVNQLAQTFNSTVNSDLLVFTEQDVNRVDIECNRTGTACRAFLPDGLVTFAGPLTPYDQVATYNGVMLHQGVSLAQRTGTSRVLGYSIDYTSYGGWLNYSAFAVDSGTITSGDLRGAVGGYAFTSGYSTNTNPAPRSGSATWEGVMVGANINLNSPALGNVVQGNAQIAIPGLSDPGLITSPGNIMFMNIDFTDIRDLKTGERHPNMSWQNVFSQYGYFSSGNSIQGKFYGPNHEEVGGTFERNQIGGAFGAKRN